MNDGQKQTVNHIYHFLRDLLYKYDTGDFLCNGMKPSQTDLKSMIRYLETNFPKDLLEHEMGDEDAIWHEEQLRAFENEGGTYSEKMQDNLEPIDDSIVMVSCCCAVEILDGDICSDCKEHCEPIPEGDGEN